MVMSGMSRVKRFSGGTLPAMLANFVICQYEYSSIICDDSCGQRLCSIQSSKDGEGEGRGAAMSGLTEGGVPLGDWLSSPSPMREDAEGKERASGARLSSCPSGLCIFTASPSTPMRAAGGGLP